MKKTVSLIVCIAFIATAGMTALAQSGSITDPTGDVWHYTWTGGVYDWNYVSNKPNIDITELSYSVSGDQVIFRMKVDGSIETSELISYHGYLNTSDSTYWFMLMNGEGMGMATSTGGDDFKYSECVVTITGDTITATYDVISTLTNVEIWGFAAEYGNLDDLYEDYIGPQTIMNRMMLVEILVVEILVVEILVVEILDPDRSLIPQMMHTFRGVKQA